MAAVLDSPSTFLTVADLLEQLGGIPPERVRLHPAPGTATVDDVVRIHAQEKRLFELVDGVLVEKAVGYAESVLAGFLIEALRQFVRPRNLGVVSGEAGMMKLFGQLVRIPDTAFVSWERLPGQRMPREKVPLLAPDLVIEVLSESNTRPEMERKRNEYFRAGVSAVWIVDPESRTVVVWTAPEEHIRLSQSDLLDGGDVLPGFSLPLQDLFAELDCAGPLAE